MCHLTVWQCMIYSASTLLQAARILRAALRTLVHCHSRGILHRDIKPGNFMFLSMDESSPIKAVGESTAALPSHQRMPVNVVSLLICSCL